MKKLLSTSALFLFVSLTALAQYGPNPREPYGKMSPSKGLSFEVRGRQTRPIKKEKLIEAKFISDIISGYPSSWITSYVSVDILATLDGKSMKATSKNATLSTEQKNILKMATIGADITVNIKYKLPNAITNNIENSNMHTSLTVVPDIEAEYIGGTQQMKTYLKENAINKIPETISIQFKQATVRFIIDERGAITNVKITKSSGDQKTDKLLLDAITKMPKWQPAKNSKGIQVKQEFEFTVSGMYNDGC